MRLSNSYHLSSDHSSVSVRNYLFIVPDELSHYERAVLKATAARLTEFGYVYVADVCQLDVEDRDHARHLPLKNRMIPPFGILDTAVIFHDLRMAREVGRLHPEARLYVLNADEAFSYSGDTMPELIMH